MLPQETIDLANQILTNLRIPCLQDNEIALIDMLCSSPSFDSASTECQALGTVLHLIDHRGLVCIENDIKWLEAYNKCHECDLNVIDEVADELDLGVFVLGGQAKGGNSC